MTRSSIALVCVAILPFVSAAGPPQVALVKSREGSQYESAMAGFRRHFKDAGVEAAFQTYSLDGDPAGASTIVERIRNADTGLVFSLGTIATQAVSEGMDTTPIVASLLVSGRELNSVENATGVTLTFPVVTELEWIVRFLPRHRRVGVLYDPDKNQSRIDLALKEAESLGLTIEAVAVRTPQEIPKALKLLSRKVDVMWGIPDTTVISPQTAKQLLLFSFRNRIPFVGISPAWVKAGALYALERDYEDLGAQCAAQALGLLKGVDPASVPLETPRQISYSVNLKTARHLKIDIPSDLLDGALVVCE